MKKLLILLIIVGSCKSNKPYYSTEKFKREEYILAYKKSILYACINEATNNNFTKFSKDNNDLRLYVEYAILVGAIDEAMELGNKLSKNIRTINYSDYQGKKPIFSDCVSFAFSKESDSIARIKYKQYKKNEK